MALADLGRPAFLLLGMSASAVYHLRWARRLPPIEALGTNPVEPTLCSVVVAARDGLA